MLMSKFLQNISISHQNLPSTRITLIFTSFTLLFSIIYILINYPSTSNRLLSISSTTLTSHRQFFPSSNSSTCDIFDGRWVYDESYKPLYAPGTCGYVEREFNCFGNGRSDLGYLKYRWQPYGCNIPRFDAEKLMEILRGKRLVFVGDSLNRNMCQSLVCSLRMFKGKSSRIGKNYSYYFKDYNCSIKFVMAPFLVKRHQPSNKKETLRLDTMEASIAKHHDVDFLIFNTGHWWNYNKFKNGENFFQEGDVVHRKMDGKVAFNKALKTWANWIDKKINNTKTRVFFVGYSSRHFRGGDWDLGGTCNNETKPITNEKQLAQYPRSMQSLASVIAKMKTPVLYLNITRLTNSRKDAHPSLYRHSKSKLRKGIVQDCAHWCLPGVPDSWNQLLFSSLLESLEGSNRVY